MAFRNFTEAISRLSISSVVFVCRNACTNSSGTAVMRPNAVQFIATEMLAERRLAFSAGLMVAVETVSEDHVTVLVRFCVLPSVNVPVAVNGCIVPSAIDGVAGVIASETRAKHTKTAQIFVRTKSVELAFTRVVF